MPDQNNFHEENSLPPDFDVSAFESTAQVGVRKAYEDLTAWNEMTIGSFDPTAPKTQADIELTTLRTEYESAEPELAEACRKQMVQDMGLSFKWLKNDDPTNMFQYQYRDGEVEQIRVLTRKDGVKIPVFTMLGNDESGNKFEYIGLMSHDIASQAKKELEDNLTEQSINSRLTEEFGLDEEFIKKTGLSLDDKREMLRDYDAIQKLEIVPPDTKELNAIRTKLVRHMMPGAAFLDGHRGRKIEQVTKTYQQQLYGLAKQYGVDRQTFAKLLKSEQLQRLSELNGQLRRRLLTRRLGTAAIVTNVVGVAAGSGAGFGLVTEQTTGAAVRDAAIAGGIGVWLGAEEIYRRHKKAKHVSGFSDLEKQYGGTMLDTQLQEEQDLATKYAILLHV